MKRSATVGLITATVLLVALQAHHAGTAGAQVGVVTLPAEVAVADRMIEVTGTVKVGPNAHGVRSATLWFSYPLPAPAEDLRADTPWGKPAKNPDPKKPVAPPSPAPSPGPWATPYRMTPTEVGSATSQRSGLLTVTARLDAARIVPGRNVLDVVDVSDGAHRTIVLDLRRQSRVSITGVRFADPGRARVSVLVKHFDPKLERFRPSHFSPMRVQEQVAGAWVTLTTITSNASGVASAVVAAGPGMHYYRVVRPGGATVTAATSKTVQAGWRLPQLRAS